MSGEVGRVSERGTGLAQGKRARLVPLFVFLDQVGDAEENEDQHQYQDGCEYQTDYAFEVHASPFGGRPRRTGFASAVSSVAFAFAFSSTATAWPWSISHCPDTSS